MVKGHICIVDLVDVFPCLQRLLQLDKNVVHKEAQANLTNCFAELCRFHPLPVASNFEANLKPVVLRRPFLLFHTFAGRGQRSVVRIGVPSPELQGSTTNRRETGTP